MHFCTNVVIWINRGGEPPPPFNCPRDLWMTPYLISIVWIIKQIMMKTTFCCWHQSKASFFWQERDSFFFLQAFSSKLFFCDIRETLFHVKFSSYNCDIAIRFASCHPIDNTFFIAKGPCTNHVDERGGRVGCLDDHNT